MYDDRTELSNKKNGWYKIAETAMTILPKDPLAGGMPIYIFLQDKIFLELHKYIALSNIRGYSLILPKREINR